jgi:DNA (cytosine-5)-methyltransferase 1
MRGHWDAYQWAVGSDGKARRIEPSIRLLAHGVPARVGRLRAYGNAIVPQVAAEVIGAYMDATG